MIVQALHSIGRVRLLAVASAAALLAVATLGGVVLPTSAQAGLEPRAADTCRATLTVSPSVVAFGAARPVTVFATGLEPGVSYRLFFNSAMVSGGSVDLDGTVQVYTTVESEIALLVNVQVVTETRCAAGALIVAGPRRATCEVALLLPGIVQSCP